MSILHNTKYSLPSLTQSMKHACFVSPNTVKQTPMLQILHRIVVLTSLWLRYTISYHHSRSIRPRRTPAVATAGPWKTRSKQLWNAKSFAHMPSGCLFILWGSKTWWNWAISHDPQASSC